MAIWTLLAVLYKLVTEPYKRIISLASRLSQKNPLESLENEISSLKALLGETNDFKSLNDSKSLYLDFQPKNVENFEVIIFILLTAIAISGQFEIGMMHIDILVRVSTSYQGMIHLYYILWNNIMESYFRDTNIEGPDSKKQADHC